jgi:hypothetical protein
MKFIIESGPAVIGLVKTSKAMSSEYRILHIIISGLFKETARRGEWAPVR